MIRIPGSIKNLSSYLKVYGIQKVRSRFSYAPQKSLKISGFFFFVTVFVTQWCQEHYPSPVTANPVCMRVQALDLAARFCG